MVFADLTYWALQKRYKDVACVKKKCVLKNTSLRTPFVILIFMEANDFLFMIHIVGHQDLRQSLGITGQKRSSEDRNIIFLSIGKLKTRKTVQVISIPRHHW